MAEGTTEPVSPGVGLARDRDGQRAVLVTISDEVAWVTLNRPDKLNAMSDRLMEELRDELARLAQDAEVRCVVLRGAGRSFCAGGDVHMMSARRSATADAASPGAAMEDSHRTLIRRSESATLLATMPKPTVAVVQGHAVGGGLSLALACDFRLAAQSARLRVGFAQNALSGDFAISFLLNRVAGASQARELMMLDPVVSGEEALSRGLVTEVHADDALDAAAQAFVARLAQGPTIAFGRIKDNLRFTEGTSMATAIEVEVANQRVAAITADAAEAGVAFAERRQPRFIGR